ncbi:ATP-dependent DNA helicase PIF1-like protein [Tanacetum coccineum]
MSGGRTAHSRFHIPINIDETSHCSISSQSVIVALLKRCKIIIWDEAPMANKLCFEALDRSLRDILRKNMYDTCEQPFGTSFWNLDMVFAVILGRSLRGYPIRFWTRYCSLWSDKMHLFKQSFLWDHCNVLKLTANMRLTVGARSEDVTEIQELAEWILKVRDCKLGEPNDGEVKRKYVARNTRNGQENKENMDSYETLRHNLYDSVTL